MNLTTENRAVSPKPKQQKIDLPSLDLKIDSLTLPDEVTTTIISKSRRSNSNTEVKKKQIPFSCNLTVGRGVSSEQESVCGLSHSPSQDFSIELSVGESGKLKMGVSYEYIDTVTRYKTETYNHRWVPEGQRYAYGPVEPGYMDCDETQVPYEETVTKRETLNAARITKEAFALIYVSLLNAEPSSYKQQLIEFLHQAFPSDCKEAQQNIRKSLVARSEKAQARAKALAEQLSTIEMPKI